MLRILITLLIVLAWLSTSCFAGDNKPSETDKARDVIEQDKKSRTKKCLEVLERVLKDNRCTIEVSMVITEKGNFPQVQIIPKD